MAIHNCVPYVIVQINYVYLKNLLLYLLMEFDKGEIYKIYVTFYNIEPL